MSKKAELLGMNPSTAQNRLVKDLLWALVAHNKICYRCKNLMARENFSIDHKQPWQKAEDPLKAYFDLDNIAFSHHSCNSAAGGKISKRTF